MEGVLKTAPKTDFICLLPQRPAPTSTPVDHTFCSTKQCARKQVEPVTPQDALLRTDAVSLPPSMISVVQQQAVLDRNDVVDAWIEDMLLAHSFAGFSHPRATVA